MPPFSELIRHRAVVIALAVAALMLAGSAAYYLIESRPPAYAFASASIGTVTEDVTGTGTVSPVQNPDLAFTSDGRVTYVGVKVGDAVRQGQLLASLDTGVLAANVASAQARLAGLVNGPRGVDLAGKQTAIDQAQQALAATYAALPATLASAAATAEDAVHTDTDPLFGNMNVATFPRVSFETDDDAHAEQAGQERMRLQDEFEQWNREVAATSASSSPAQLSAAIDSALARLTLVQAFFTDFTAAANAAHPELPAAQLAAVNGGRAAVNGLVLSLTQQKQSLANQRLAVQSAQDAYALAQAGATSEDRQAAQAAVDAAVATLRQSQIIAPFSGTVASVAVKQGDVVGKNATAVSLVPGGAFEVDVYLSELDMTRVHPGDHADVTLDAYGAGTPFGATVGSLDAAPTNASGAPSYKATLVFDAADPRVKAGMRANASIHAAAVSDALTVPAAAVGADGQGTYVLKRAGGGGVVRTPVTVGVRSATAAQITSGLSAGDEVAFVTGG